MVSFFFHRLTPHRRDDKNRRASLESGCVVLLVDEMIFFSAGVDQAGGYQRMTMLV